MRAWDWQSKYCLVIPVLDDVEPNLKMCGKHLDHTKTRNTKIESFLVLSFLVYMCREYEHAIYDALARRARRSGDTSLASFVTHAIKHHRHMNLDDLRKNVLAKFDQECLQVFDSAISAKQKAGYSNIIRNRNAVAHQGPVQLTFADLEKYHLDAQGILTAFEVALEQDGKGAA